MTPIEWNPAKENDKEFLKKYYAYRAYYWRSKGFEKIAKKMEGYVK